MRCHQGCWTEVLPSVFCALQGALCPGNCTQQWAKERMKGPRNEWWAPPQPPLWSSPQQAIHAPTHGDGRGVRRAWRGGLWWVCGLFLPTFWAPSRTLTPSPGPGPGSALCPGVTGRPVTLSEPRSLSWWVKITLTLTLSLYHSGDPDSWASHWMILAVGNVHDTEIINEGIKHLSAHQEHRAGSMAAMRSEAGSHGRPDGGGLANRAEESGAAEEDSIEGARLCQGTRQSLPIYALPQDPRSQGCYRPCMTRSGAPWGYGLGEAPLVRPARS